MARALRIGFSYCFAKAEYEPNTPGQAKFAFELELDAYHTHHRPVLSEIVLHRGSSKD